jgi:hypothetical protein
VRPKYAQQHSQPVMAPCTTGSSLDSMLRVATTVQQTMSAANAADSEEKMTKIVMTIINLTGR